ncbi:GTPase of the ras superfamily required to recruit Arl1p to the Golgi [Neoconidiobolus thromboides FSU 785]|nr:GTPase of the ras superfamily required to recruit Arl1p to the Golgi [Neoconidiobolus thromboides FSU 785]
MYSILIIGLDNAGKTTLLEKIKQQYLNQIPLPPEKIAPTVGLNMAKIQYEKNSIINFWDLGGQSDLQNIWKNYYSECHGICFVIDATDKERLEQCKLVFEKLVLDDRIQGVPIVMLANKQDITGKSLSVESIKEIFNKIAIKLEASDSKVLPISALTGLGVGDAIDWLCSRMILNKLERPPVLK